MHTRRAFLATALLCSCLECIAHPQTADMRIDLTPGRMVVAAVELQGDERPRWFAVDTGATTTMLDTGFATTLGLVPTATLPIVTAGGRFSVPAGIIPRLSIGGVRIYGLPVSWIGLDRLRSEDRRITGVIGQDVLSRNTLTIDYARRRLRLDEEPCGAGDMSGAIERIDGRPAIHARVGTAAGNRSVRLVIDSAANALVLFDAAAGASRTVGIRLATHTGEVRVSAIPRAQVSIDGVRLSGPAVVVPPAEHRYEDGLLPASWFSRVCIDGARATAVLTR